MAITRAQQFRQMYQFGGGADAGGKESPGGGTFGGAKDFGGGGDNTRTRIQDERQRDFQKQQLRDLTRNIDFDQGDTSLDVRQRPRGLGNLASLILSGVTKLPFSLISKMDLSGPPQSAGLTEMDFGPANPKFLFPRMAQGPRTMGTMPTEEEEETPFRLAPRFRAEGGSMNDEVVGGEMDFESARQMYGLGKLVKKVTRSVKKIAKSPVGKAAIAFALYKGANNPAFKKFLVGAGGRDAYMGSGPTKGILGVGGKFSPFKTILAASGIAGLMSGQEEEDETVSPEQLGPSLNIPEYRRDPFGNLAIRFRAEGGSTEAKEPVAKKTMPLLDMGGMEKDYREDGGFVPIGRMEKADDVPARLSKNEFVFTADAVRNAGDGNVDKGAEVMYNMMKNLEAGGKVSEESQGLEGARRMFQTSQRLEEVL
jgi:hypothetical protein